MRSLIGIQCKSYKIGIEWGASFFFYNVNLAALFCMTCSLKSLSTEIPEKRALQLSSRDNIKDVTRFLATSCVRYFRTLEIKCFTKGQWKQKSKKVKSIRA